MKYGIVCAMQEEIGLLLPDIVGASITKIAGRDFYEGKLYGKDSVVVMSRIGKVASALTVTAMINRFHVDCIIFCGTAGGINPSLSVGDIVVADRLVQHDFFTGTDYFRIPLIDVSYFQPDIILSEKVFRSVEEYIGKSMFKEIPKQYLDEFSIQSPKVVTGTIASGDQFICDESRKQWLIKNIDNLKCVEMEGAAIAQVCYEYQIPYAVMRVISDSANDTGCTDFERFVANAACHFTRGSLKAFLSSN